MNGYAKHLSVFSLLIKTHARFPFRQTRFTIPTSLGNSVQVIERTRHTYFILKDEQIVFIRFDGRKKTYLLSAVLYGELQFHLQFTCQSIQVLSITPCYL